MGKPRNGGNGRAWYHLSSPLASMGFVKSTEVQEIWQLLWAPENPSSAFVLRTWASWYLYMTVSEVGTEKSKWAPSFSSTSATVSLTSLFGDPAAQGMFFPCSVTFRWILWKGLSLTLGDAGCIYWQDRWLQRWASAAGCNTLTAWALGNLEERHWDVFFLWMVQQCAASLDWKMTWGILLEVDGAIRLTIGFKFWVAVR